MDLTPKRFGEPLGWLDPDCERAGERYKEIRGKLAGQTGEGLAARLATSTRCTSGRA